MLPCRGEPTKMGKANLPDASDDQSDSAKPCPWHSTFSLSFAAGPAQLYLPSPPQKPAFFLVKSHNATGEDFTNGGLCVHMRGPKKGLEESNWVSTNNSICFSPTLCFLYLFRTAFETAEVQREPQKVCLWLDELTIYVLIVQ